MLWKGIRKRPLRHRIGRIKQYKQSDMSATVTVVMATYNGEKYLAEQLDSILAQTYPVSEIIVCDDRSTDGTPALVRSYAARHPEIKFIENVRNVGCNLTFKAAAMAATGDFVAFSDQDDVWYPEKIARQMAHIGGHDICYTDLDRGPAPGKTHVVSYKGFFEANLFFGIAGHTMLLRRDFIQQEAHWLDDFWYDWSLLLHAHLHRGVVKLAEPMNWHRDYPDSVTNSQHDKYYKTGQQFPAYEPYVEGLKNFRRLQQKPRYRRLFRYMSDQTAGTEHRLVHTLCGLLLKRDALSLLRLMWLCMKHRTTIYPSTRTNGLRGCVRGFFYPFIWAHHSTVFDD